MRRLVIGNTNFKLILNIPDIINAPSNLTATVISSSRIDLTWTDNSSDETSFSLERSLDGVTGWSVINSPSANTTSYSDTGLTASTTYYYRIKSVGVYNSSSYSSVANGTTSSSGAFAAPTNLQITSNRGTALTVGWSDNTGGVAYTQHSYSYDNITYDDDYYGVTSPGVTTKTFNYLVQNSLLYVRMRATNNIGGYGSWSTPISGYLSANVPYNLIWEGAGPTTALVSWIDNSTYESGYEVRYSGATDNAWLSSSVATDITCILLSGLTPNKVYYTQVRSLTTHTQSDWTAVASGITPTESVPAAPSSLLTYPITSSLVAVAWTRNSTNEEYFEVQYCLDSGGSPDNNWSTSLNTYPTIATQNINGLTALTKYWVRVRATNNAGSSSWVVSSTYVTTLAVSSSLTGRYPSINWSASQQSIWDQMKTDYTASPSSNTLAVRFYRKLKELADNSLTINDVYANVGLPCAIMYQITGSGLYAEKSIKMMKSAFGGVTPYSDSSREYFPDLVTQFDYVYPALSAYDKSYIISKLKGLAQGELDNFRTADSDQVTSAGFGGIALLSKSPAVITNPECSGYINHSYHGGLVPTGIDLSTFRNSVNTYARVLSSGGEWCESTEYNLGTLSLLLTVYNGLKTSTGIDYLPEVSGEFANIARVALIASVPSQAQAIQWGDNQNIRVAELGLRTTVLGMVAGLLKGRDEGRWALKQYHDSMSGVNIDWSMGHNPIARVAYTIDPYQPEASYMSGMYTHYAGGQGTLYHHDGYGYNDSLFFSKYDPRQFFVDHQTRSWGDFQLWRKNEWAITHPIGYGLNDVGEWYALNGMGVGGLSSFRGDRNILGQYTPPNRAYSFICGKTGGKYYGNSEPAFCNEFSRNIIYLPSVGKTVDTIITYDRVDAVPPSSLSTPSQIQSLYDTVEATHILNPYFGGSGTKQWVIHSPTPTTNTSTSISWDTTGGQHVIVRAILPSSVYMTSFTETDFMSYQDFGDERKYQTRIRPTVTQQWDTFLNVVQVYDGSLPTTPTLVRSSSGEAVEGCIITRSGEQDYVPLFCGKTTANNNILNSGAIVAYTQTTASGYVILTNLNMSKTWRYSVDGGPSTAIDVASMGVATILVSGISTHTLAFSGV